ncbi:leo1-like protein [Ditylenchus destructor]|nr:leo1-like protein [Ditylenchus destructor]
MDHLDTSAGSNSSIQQMSDENMHEELTVVYTSDRVIVEAPSYLKFETTPFDLQTFDEIFSIMDHSDDETQVEIKHMIEDTVRWRISMDEAGNEIRESNAKLYKWSDGSVSLHIGSKMFAVEKYATAKDLKTKILIKPFVTSPETSEISSDDDSNNKSEDVVDTDEEAKRDSSQQIAENQSVFLKPVVSISQSRDMGNYHGLSQTLATFPLAISVPSASTAPVSDDNIKTTDNSTKHSNVSADKKEPMVASERVDVEKTESIYSASNEQDGSTVDNETHDPDNTDEESEQSKTVSIHSTSDNGEESPGVSGSSSGTGYIEDSMIVFNKPTFLAPYQNKSQPIYSPVSQKDRSQMYLTFSEDSIQSNSDVKADSPADKDRSLDLVIDDQVQENDTESTDPVGNHPEPSTCDTDKPASMGINQHAEEKKQVDRNKPTLLVVNKNAEENQSEILDQQEHSTPITHKQDSSSVAEAVEEKDPLHSVEEHQEHSSELVEKDATQKLQPNTRYQLRTRKPKRSFPEYTTSEKSSDEASVSTTKKKRATRKPSVSSEAVVGNVKKERVSKQSSLRSMPEGRKKSTNFKKYRNTKAPKAGSDSMSVSIFW